MVTRRAEQGWGKTAAGPGSFLLMAGLMVGFMVGLMAVLWVSGAVAKDDSDNNPPTDPAKYELQTQIESGSDLTPRGRKTLFRARTHQDAGRFTESADLLGKWLDGHPEREHHLLRFQQGIAYLGLSENERALDALQAAVEKESRFARAWLRLGEIAYELERFEVAAEAFNQGYDLNPVQRPEFLYYGCVASLRGGASDRALDDLDRLLTRHRREAPLEWYRALVAAAADVEQEDRTQQPSRAASHLQAALADHAEDPGAWELAYRFAAGREDYEAATVYLTITGYLRELTRQERIQLGDLYAVINAPLQAARNYEIALGLDLDLDSQITEREGGRSRTAEYERLAGAWLAAHRPDETRAALRKALSKTETRRLWSMLGDLDHLAEDYAGALEAYGRGCELDPEFGRGWLMMGYCCQELDRPDEARKHLRKAAEFPDQAAGARVLLAE